jgi:hypothetical protein
MMPDVRWLETTVATWISGSEPSCHPVKVECVSESEVSCGAQHRRLTLEEGCLGRCDEALLRLESGDGVELAKSSETLRK